MPSKALTRSGKPRPKSKARARVYAKRRSNRVARVDNDLTDEQWEAIRAAWGGCAYCGAPSSLASPSTGNGLQKDCVLPIARGGRYTVTNVVPACRSCNASKCDMEVTKWLRIKKYDESAFLVRFAQITRLLAVDV